jgi:hypothetical protein
MRDNLKECNMLESFNVNGNKGYSLPAVLPIYIVWTTADRAATLVSLSAEQWAIFRDNEKGSVYGFRLFTHRA